MNISRACRLAAMSTCEKVIMECGGLALSIENFEVSKTQIARWVWAHFGHKRKWLPYLIDTEAT
jgi:hypothetical protein